MPDECTGKDYFENHVKQMASLEASTKSAHHRIDELSKVYAELIKISGTMEKVLIHLDNHGQKIEKIVEEVEGVQAIMETKETVSKLDQKITDLDQRIDDIERTPGNDAQKLLKQIRWLLLSFVITGIAVLFWDRLMTLF